jgi:hypothetical protein
MLKKLLAVTCLMMSMAVNAAPVAYTISDFREGIFSGGFSYDGFNFSDVDVFSEASEIHYVYLNGDAQLANSFVAVDGGQSYLQIFFLTKLDEIDKQGAAAKFTEGCAQEGACNGLVTIYSNPIVKPVPLPAAAWLFGSALLGLGALKRKKA